MRFLRYNASETESGFSRGKEGTAVQEERREAPIGIFDSGVGGISVLYRIHKELPGEALLYYGDTAHAPYGTRTREEVLGYCNAIVAHFQEDAVKAIVIACNTASAVAAADMRARLRIPVIAMEPALKPASEMRQTGKVLVLATPMTLKLPKFQALYAKYGEGAVPVPCPGLMDLVESQDTRGEHRYLEEIFTLYPPDTLDAVVLGCTHYVFLRPLLHAMLPDSVHVLDGNEGTARQLRRVLAQKDLLSQREEGSIRLETSGDASTVIPQMRRLLSQLAAQSP